MERVCLRQRRRTKEMARSGKQGPSEAAAALLRWSVGLVALWWVLASAAAAAPAKRAIMISWDGAADWVVDRLLAEGRLPNLARLARRGAGAEYCVPTSLSKTAAGHAALWTGVTG